jgi:2,4-dienoyl-CoA reductase-like NADH-dependent reductase (Old Yellow Enzyme family)
MPHLFDAFELRSLRLANRIIVSPMCQYSSVDGLISPWHEVHLATRAVGGAGLVFTEATAVTADGRISPQDLGIWDDTHLDGLARVAHLIKTQGAAAGIQLAHAGRKASTSRPWEGSRGLTAADGGWVPIGPTSTPFSRTYVMPREATPGDLAGVVQAFCEAARRALDARFDVLEIHAAHGYLIHEFLSPLVNTRTDAYGGSFANRVRLCLEIVEAVRRVWPERSPLFVRISATDWVDGGWDLDQSVELARRLRDCGADLIDCSSGGLVPDVKIPIAPGYQVPFAERIRRDAAVATGAVGLITGAGQADEIIAGGRADCVLLAREMLRDPYWPLHAARELGRQVAWPAQYLRAAPDGSPQR